LSLCFCVLILFNFILSPLSCSFWIDILMNKFAKWLMIFSWIWFNCPIGWITSLLISFFFKPAWKLLDILLYLQICFLFRIINSLILCIFFFFTRFTKTSVSSSIFMSSIITFHYIPWYLECFSIMSIFSLLSFFPLFIMQFRFRINNSSN